MDNPEEKAKRLFLSLLAPEQLEQWKAAGYITVIGGSTNKRYALYPGYSGNIRMVGEQSQTSCPCQECRGNKTTVRALCCHMITMDVPYWDHMVAQLLHIRYNEAAFLQVAYIS